MVNITEELLNEKFNEFNEKYFNGEITKLNFKISKCRSIFGRFYPVDRCIEISIAYIRSERDYWNTLLHEMIHAYVRQKYGLFVKHHGFEWKTEAKRINTLTKGKYGIIKRVGGGQDEYTLRP